MESKTGVYKCCNPLKLENHVGKTGLRIASKRFRDLWNLNCFHYLCASCRKKMGSLKSVSSTPNHISSESDMSEMECNTEDSNVLVAENDDTNDNNVAEGGSNTKIESVLTPASISTDNSFSPGLKSLSSKEVICTLSQLSLGTQLPVVNQALQLLNITPLNKYAIDNPDYLICKYNEICSTFATLLSLDDESNHYMNSLNYQDILRNLKTKLDDASTNRNKKIQILTLLPSDWSIQRICDVMGVTKHMAIVSKHLKENKGILSTQERKKGRPLTDEIKSKVLEFYQSDDVSVNLPGKKDFVSVRRGEGQREHVQKRLILCNLKELHQTFKEQYPSELIGFSSFASLRPVHCVLAGSSGSHTVCVCAVHQNIKLMMLGSRLAALTGNLADPLMHYTNCFKIILCTNPSSDCYLLKCNDCPGIDVLQNVLETIFDENDLEDITYKYWVSNPRCSLETIIKSSSEFVEIFCDHVKNLLPHDFISKEQSAFMKKSKEALQDNEALAVCDFAENYAFLIQNAVPGFHFNNDQATIFPVVIYFKQSNELTHRSLVIISDNNSHDFVAVYVYLKIVTDFIKESVPNASKVFYFSDGAPQQFKNYKNFVNIYHHKEDFNLETEWHYFATAHGKGPCDGVGGTVKRKVARASLQRPMDQHITTADELYEWASKPTSLPNIHVKFSPEMDYLDAKEKLNSRYNTAKTITGTQKFHAIIPKDNGNILSKEYSSSQDSRLCKIFKRTRK